MLRISDCVRNLVVPQPTEGQRNYDTFLQRIKTISGLRSYMELTITQNGALFLAHNRDKISKHRAALFWPLRARASKQDAQYIRGLKFIRLQNLRRAH